jgi:ankyrin repeat protein
MLAAQRGHAEVVRILLGAGADVGASVNDDAAWNSAFTAVEYAAMSGHLEVVQALVAAGADVNRRDEDGRRAAQAAKAGNVAVVAFLCRVPQAAPDKHILAACWLGDVQRVRDFIARGASVEERDLDRATCLMLAAMRGHVEVVRALLDAGANVAAADRPGTCVLSYAVGRPAILAALLARFVVGGDAQRQAQLNKAHRKAVALGSPEGAESAHMLVAAGAVLPPPMP